MGRASDRGSVVLTLAAAAALATGCVTLSPGPSEGPDGSSLALASGLATPQPRATAHGYRVRSGDTLYTIARRFGLTIGQLLAANPSITDPNLIAVGQTLVIPPPDAPDTGPNAASLGDGRDDVADSDGVPVAGQSYADITSVSARVDQGGTLAIEVVLVHAPPARADPAVERLSYTVVLDIDGDDQPDYRLVYGNGVEGQGQGEFGASLEDRTSGGALTGDAFPGTVTVGDRAITFRMRRGAIGGARTYALAAKAERSFFPGGSGDPDAEASVDYAPDQQWPRPNPRWIEVGGA